jgi:chloramphenicol 3-O-phosphotransferase
VIISVVSGKGGAGKTTLAASIAQVFEAEFYDLDVDAPTQNISSNQTSPVKFRLPNPSRFSPQNSVTAVVFARKSVAFTPFTEF